MKQYFIAIDRSTIRKNPEYEDFFTERDTREYMPGMQEVRVHGRGELPAYLENMAVVVTNELNSLEEHIYYTYTAILLHYPTDDLIARMQDDPDILGIEVNYNMIETTSIDNYGLPSFVHPPHKWLYEYEDKQIKCPNCEKGRNWKDFSNISTLYNITTKCPYCGVYYEVRIYFEDIDNVMKKVPDNQLV